MGRLAGGRTLMKTIPTVHRLTTTRTWGWKGAPAGAMLLLSIAVTVPSAQGFTTMLAPEQVLARMEQQYEQQVQALESYQARRRYSVTNGLLGDPAYLLVEEQYGALEGKQFRVLERGGSRQVEQRVFSRLLQVEQETSRDPAREAVKLCRRNYNFTFIQYDPTKESYVFQVEPRTSNPYLLRGTIWVDAGDFAVRRIEGQPAARQSSFVRQTRFVHEFAKFGDFWLPVRHHSESDVVLLGRAILEIQYFNYQWQERREEKR
ncbi:MAG: hypothetical protein HY648_14495 [Acidobacteria bacterium]|nr:hypothetical protein [Acidobacteriota bacterium]